MKKSKSLVSQKNRKLPNNGVDTPYLQIKTNKNLGEDLKVYKDFDSIEELKLTTQTITQLMNGNLQAT
jgi:hypothetical protein